MNGLHVFIAWLFWAVFWSWYVWRKEITAWWEKRRTKRDAFRGHPELEAALKGIFDGSKEMIVTASDGRSATLRTEEQFWRLVSGEMKLRAPRTTSVPRSTILPMWDGDDGSARALVDRREAEARGEANYEDRYLPMGRAHRIPTPPLIRIVNPDDPPDAPMEIIRYDPLARTIDVFGIKYALRVFEAFASAPEGSAFRIVRREGDTVTIQDLTPDGANRWRVDPLIPPPQFPRPKALPVAQKVSDEPVRKPRKEF